MENLLTMFYTAGGVPIDKALIIRVCNLFFVLFAWDIRSDALLTSSINLATSLLAGFVIFAVLGYMAEIRNVSIDQLGLEGLLIRFLFKRHRRI